MSARPAQVIIHGEALRHNVQRVRRYAPDSKVMPAIKADAYGHGVLRVADYLQSEVDGFALATLGEAIQLREAGIRQPLLVFQGAHSYDDLRLAIQHDLRIVLHQYDQLQLLQDFPGSAALPIAIKIDTGMHRLGLTPTDAEFIIERLTPAGMDIWLMTHFSCADDIDNPSTTQQINTFNQIADRYPDLPRTLANSAGIVAWPDAHQQWVRPGIMFYGGNPLLTGKAADLGLQAAMTLQAPLIAVRQLQKGDAVGYGATWKAVESTRVGVVACGYADGYPRHAPTGTPVWVNGHHAFLLGRVSMDLVVIHLQDIPARQGDMAELWGQNIPIDDVARLSETISYELMCHAGSLCERIFEP